MQEKTLIMEYLSNERSEGGAKGLPSYLHTTLQDAKYGSYN